MERLGAYDLLSELGRGAMGVVYRARHRPTGAERALKVLTLPAEDPEALERFRREATALARLGGHPGIVRVHEAGTEGRSVYFVMEYVPGAPLAKTLARGRLEAGEAVVLGAKLARALAHCHAQGVVHRDVKPGNVLLDEAGDPRLVDFGLVRDLAAPRLTMTGTFIGTPAYMAPEQILGAKATPATDVYALGVVLYEALAGERPYAAVSLVQLSADITLGKHPPLHARRPELPAKLVALVERALSKEPGSRPGADELGRELDALGRAMKKQPLVTASAVHRARGLLVALVLVASALAAVVVGVALARRPEAPPPPRPTEAPRAREKTESAEDPRLASVWARFQKDGDRDRAFSDLRKQGGVQTDYFAALVGLEALDAIAATCSLVPSGMELFSVVHKRNDALQAPLERALRTLTEVQKHPRYLDRAAELAALERALELIALAPNEFYPCEDDTAQRDARLAATAALTRGLVGLAEQVAGGEQSLLARPHQVLAWSTLSRMTVIPTARELAQDGRRIELASASLGRLAPPIDRRLRLLVMERMGHGYMTGTVSLETACEFMEAAAAAFTGIGDEGHGGDTWLWLECQAAFLCARVALESSGQERETWIARAEGHLAKARERPETRWRARMLAPALFLLAFDRGDLDAAEKATAGFNLSGDEDDAVGLELLLAGELRRRQGRSAEAEKLLVAALEVAEAEKKVGRHGPFWPLYDCRLARWLVVAKDPEQASRAREEIAALHAERANWPRPLSWISAEVEALLR